ncbi:MAG: hypothetical protein QM680_10525 [Luteolibacter sp.]
MEIDQETKELVAERLAEKYYQAGLETRCALLLLRLIAPCMIKPAPRSREGFRAPSGMIVTAYWIQEQVAAKATDKKEEAIGNQDR